MRCDAIREMLEGLKPGEMAAEVQRHLAACPACAAYARDWRLVRGGFVALAGEGAPEASAGFTARLLRRIEERGERGAPAGEFLERVGRRVVLATLALTLALLLALVLPKAGPLRGAATFDPAPAQAEAAPAEDDPVFASDGQQSPNLPPTPTPEGHEKGKR